MPSWPFTARLCPAARSVIAEGSAARRIERVTRARGGDGMAKAIFRGYDRAALDREYNNREKVVNGG
ncbi:MAG: hypothetical protein ACRD1P_08640 [Thermoanaerobaculia bacterium]